MPAERAGYTVTMFAIDVSKSMSKLRIVETPDSFTGEMRAVEMTNLEWALQYVKLKIQEMIYNGRKTDQCGVIIFGSEETNNIINRNSADGGYQWVSEYIPIAQPNGATIAKIGALEPTKQYGDPVDALIVAIETQAQYLANRKSWTRKIILVTDGENPIEVEDWELTVQRMNDTSVSLTVIGIDFDDEEYGFKEEDKSHIKKRNEEFYELFTSKLKQGVVGTYAYALAEIGRPDIKQVKSVLSGTVLRLGDVDTRSEQAFEISIKTSKCTAITRPKSWKKFAIRPDEEKKKKEKDDNAMIVDEDGDQEMTDSQDVGETGQADGKKVNYVPLKQRTEYYIDRSEENDEDDERLQGLTAAQLLDPAFNPHLQKVEKEQLVRGFKYGTSYVPCPDGQFPRLPTKKGIDICGFFSSKHLRRELAMSEVQYVWADPDTASQQVALSSIVQALHEKGAVAIGRWVTKDGMDPKMGVLAPCMFDRVDCLLWVQMPFADDVRKYTFASLDHLVSKKGEVVTDHPYLPTEEQIEAMDEFVDAMDLMEADKDEEGNRTAWFDTRLSYNPAIHRIKQALFHCAIVSDIAANPLPPPHPELLKYFDPPKKVLKRAQASIEKVKNAMKVRQVPKKVAKARKDGHQHAQDDDDVLLLDRKPSTVASSSSQIFSSSKAKEAEAEGKPADDSETEDDESDSELLLSNKKKQDNRNPLPTPARSVSPAGGDSLDPQIDEGRIIGRTHPLKDFKTNISRGDIVTKAVEDLSAVITEIVMRPFANRRRDEMVECMKVMRDTCLKEDEIDAWNSFLKTLKEKCQGYPGNKQFWSHLQGIGREISLISNDEAKKYCGTSNVDESGAIEFFE